MLQIQDTRFSCKACERRYRWKPALAGRNVRCKCGSVIVCPLREPEPDNLYEIVPELEKPKVPRAARPVLAYQPPAVENSALERYFPDRVKDLYAPLWLIGGAAVIQM